MISVTVNKDLLTMEEGTTVDQLLQQRNAKSRSAVWINGVQLLLAEYSSFEIKDGDVIKILRVVAGG